MSLLISISLAYTCSQIRPKWIVNLNPHFFNERIFTQTKYFVAYYKDCRLPK